MIVWRPVMAKLVRLEAVLDGKIEMEHLIKLNALMDAQAYQQASYNEED